MNRPLPARRPNPASESLAPPPPSAVAVPVQEGKPASGDVGEAGEGGPQSENELQIFEAVPLFILQRLLNDKDENAAEAISQQQV